MATDVQIEANRRNASKSTGPKTEKGKAKSRLNALKHGGRAKTTQLMPVLPHEDSAELDDWRPRNAVERELARRGARLSWALERGERFEAAHLAHRVRMAERKAGPTSGASARRMERVSDLGRKLFYDYQKMDREPLPAWGNDPAVFVAGLEESREGCRWLLARWLDLRAAEESGAPWSDADVYRFVRLLGKHGVEAVNDRELNALFQALDVCWPGEGRGLWERLKFQTSVRETAFVTAMTWRQLAPRPCSEAEAVAFIRGLIDDRIARLEELVAEFDAIAAFETADAADRAAFDPSPAFDRHRRHQASLGRELLRTVESLRRLQKLDVERTDVVSEATADAEEGQVETCENATNEAKVEFTQEPLSNEVKSVLGNYEDVNRSQSAAAPRKLPLTDRLFLAVTTGPEEYRNLIRN